MDESGLTIALKLVLVLALLLANGLFVAAEFAIVASRRTRVERLVAAGNPMAALVRRAMHNTDNFIAATQLGITMASIGLGWIGEPFLADLMEPAFGFLPEKEASITSHGVAVAVAFGFITSMHIILGELAPKSMALTSPEKTALLVVPPTEVFRRLFWLPIWLLNNLANSVIRAFGMEAPPSGRHTIHTAEELHMLVTESREAGMLREEGAVLERVFQFRDRHVNEVMVPRTEIVWLEKGATLRDLYRVFSQASHSRFPVYQGDYDNVLGVVAIKDVLRSLAEGRLNPESPLDGCIRPALFVPETKPVGDLFWEMQRQRQRVALVVDEYGGIAGMITLEMLLEQMVGQLSEEGEPVLQEVVTIDDRTVHIDAGMSIHEANEALGLGLPEGQYETVAGFILSRLGHIPKEGEQIEHNGWQMAVAKMQGVKIQRALLTRVQE